MKKIIFALVCLLFVPIGVNAIGVKISCDGETLDADNKLVKNCTVYVESATETEKFYGIKLDWILNNATLKSAEVMDSRIKFESNTNAGFAVKVEPVYGDVEDTGIYITGFTKLNIVKASFFVTDSSKECTVNISPTAWSCKSNNGTYYNRAGEVVTYKEFQADCGQLTCEEYNGKYYNSKGVAVSENEYKADCGKFSCETDNGKYYGNDGKEITKEAYEKECLPQKEIPKCKIEDGKYYDSEGKEVTKEAYEKACLPQKETPKCKMEDGKYYDSEGKEVTKEAYEKACLPQKETPKCKIEDGKYYGSEGKEVTKEVYEKECPGEEVKTGIVSYTVIIIGIMVIAGTLYYHTKKRNYFN